MRAAARDSASAATLAACLFLAGGCTTTWSRPEAEELAAPQQVQVGCPEPVHQARPVYGERTLVDRLPEATRKVNPEYPETAREARVEGTVMVAALVCEHGRVVETRVVKSIPMLDAAAEQSVYQSTYRPALQSGRPVPCWVEAPVTYSLH